MEYKFEIGQVVEMVRGQKEINWYRTLLRRWFRRESVVQEFMDSNQARDGDLYEVFERRMKKDRKGTEHDLYLCRNLKLDEFTLFGRSGLRDHARSEDNWQE